MWQQIFSSLKVYIQYSSNAVVWTVSTCPLIFKSSRPYINPLVTVLSAPITSAITFTFMFHSFSNFLSRYLSFFSVSFSFTQWSAGMAKSTIWLVLFFCWLSLGLVVWQRLDDLFVWIKILEKFVHLIFLDRFWVVHIPFVRMVKFKLLAQFPVNSCTHQVVSSLIFFLY